MNESLNLVPDAIASPISMWRRCVKPVYHRRKNEMGIAMPPGQWTRPRVARSYPRVETRPCGPRPATTLPILKDWLASQRLDRTDAISMFSMQPPTPTFPGIRA